MQQCASKDEREDRKPARADFDHQKAGLARKSSTPCEASVLLNLKEAQGFGLNYAHTSASLLGDGLYTSEVHVMLWIQRYNGEERRLFSLIQLQPAFILLVFTVAVLNVTDWRLYLHWVQTLTTFSGSKDQITVHPQCILSAFTSVLPCDQTLSDCKMTPNN